nr:putative bromo adjacent homology (BAH) domain protein [Tanacetum cinerariifolium]
MTNTQTPTPATIVVNPTGAPVTNTVANHAERPKKFNGQDLKRWQQKMFFYLTTLGLARFLKETVPQVEPPAEVAAIIEKLLPSWVDFKNYLKHKRKEMSVEDLVICLCIKEDNRLAKKDTYTPDSVKADTIDHVGSSTRAVDNGQKLYMGNSVKTDIKGEGDVVLKMKSEKELKLTNVLELRNELKYVQSGVKMNEIPCLKPVESHLLSVSMAKESTNRSEERFRSCGGKRPLTAISESESELSKKARGSGDGEVWLAANVKKVAEMLLVLATMVEMRGGRKASSIEVEMMIEARRKLVEICEEFGPKDVFENDVFGIIVDDLGLGRMKETKLAACCPKMSIVDKLEATK